MSEVKISINSDLEIQSMHAIDSRKQKIKIENNQPFDITYGWFELKIPFLGEKNEFYKIFLNDVDIEHLIYTGYFENSNGKKFQPACTVWEEGFFKIWLHTDVGYFKSSLFGQINNGDYGKNLFENYMLTCDFSVKLDENLYDKDICDFFNYNFGPTWWSKKDISRPYEVLEISNEINKTKLEKEVLEIAKFKTQNSDNWYGYSLKEKDDLSIIDINVFEGELRKVLGLIGYKSIIDISMKYLQSKSSIRIHIDDHHNKVPWQYDCKKFYWTLGDTEKVYFKFYKAGILPIEKPLLINSAMHVHSVVNDSDNLRPTLMIYGDLD